MKSHNLKSLQEILGYQFRNEDLVKTALTHRSSLNLPGVTESYERLEFLGDAILEMLISSYLFNMYPDKKEGYLTAARSAIVRTESLSAISQRYHFNDFIHMSKGEEATGGRQNPSILEDVIESLIGALYLDGGVPAAKTFFENFVLPNAKTIIAKNHLKDPKSTLQEKVQSDGLPSPVYKTIGESGKDHDKIFEVAVFINEKQYGTGTGKNKQEAEQKAAQSALELI